MGEQSAVTQLNLTSARLQLSRLSHGSLAKVLRHACKISAQALEVTRVGVWMFEPEHDLLRCIAHYTPEDAPLPAPFKMSAIPKYVAAVKELRFVSTANAQLDPHTQELAPHLKTHGITSMLDAAFYRAGQVVGIVCHERVGEPREFTVSEREFAASVGDVVAYLIEADNRIGLERRVHELEVSLKDAQRIETVSRFAAGIAHDLGNLLTVVTTGLEVLDRQGQANPDVLKMMRETTAHGSALSRQLTRLTKGSSNAVDRQELLGKNLKQSWCALLGAVVKAPWSVVLDVDPDARVWADAVQLEQVLLNLVFNARDAMPKGGPVLVRLKPHDEQLSKLEVVDTGVGIAKEHLDDVFAPYFTTKGERGTGLGLSTVQFLVHEHGGRVGLSSSVGDGTTVTVYWPRSEAPLPSR